jgi:hypothetical protein
MAMPQNPNSIKTAPDQLGIFSRHLLRLSVAASLIFRRNTRLGRTFRMLSSGGTVKSKVASRPRLKP